MSASTDPGVATIFATHSEQFGAGVVHIARSSSFSDVERVDGGIFQAEAEVMFGSTPEEFAARADQVISASAARSILKEMDIHIPRQIPLEDMTYVLESTPKLSPQHIEEFLRRARGE